MELNLIKKEDQIKYLDLLESTHIGNYFQEELNYRFSLAKMISETKPKEVDTYSDLNFKSKTNIEASKSFINLIRKLREEVEKGTFKA